MQDARQFGPIKRVEEKLHGGEGLRGSVRGGDDVGV